MNLKQCPSCERPVLPKSDGNCPSCGSDLADGTKVESSVSEVRQSLPIQPGESEMKLFRDEDRIMFRARLCWLVPAILLGVDVIARWIIGIFPSFASMRVWLMTCIVVGAVALVAAVIIRIRHLKQFPEVRRHLLASLVISSLLIAWGGNAYLILSQQRERAIQIYESQLKNSG